ncbi:hypothetical protein LOTGIDRAFT_155368 [Lottia gigantea]|uniref:Reverse transcriptase zinc-binding domain-containing protein n=1 Tax=Lottia gigantea TaxID=225164 RepID=V4B6B6_LOTGI|nr:hypothetical protein LOTGIDRAFT_155368 [Lottia gigantea]ESO84054.1 hypothetical protein LOTGIDRAFT_155368 [Lottia gigantea]
MIKSVTGSYQGALMCVRRRNLPFSITWVCLYVTITMIKSVTGSYQGALMCGFLQNHSIIDIIEEQFPELDENKITDTFDHIKASVPATWREIIDSSSFNVHPGENFFNISNSKVSPDQLTSKFCYKILSKLKDATPTAVHYWEKQNLGVNWPQTFNNVFKNYKSPKMIDLDFRIAHNVIWTMAKLKRIEKVESDLCPVCGDEPETIEHLFVDCLDLSFFTYLIEQMLKDILPFTFTNLDFKCFMLFGLQHFNKSIPSELLNIILSCARQTILTRRYVYIDKPNANLDLVILYKNVLANALIYLREFFPKHVFIQKFILPSCFVNIQLDNSINIEFC